MDAAHENDEGRDMTAPLRNTAPVYDPTCFDVETLEEAAKVILTPEAGLTSNERWQHEAPALMRLIVEHLQLDGDKTILDYGCGVGRLAKPLIGYHDCTVIGVDISSSMRALAAICVDSDRFFALAPAMMRFVFRCDYALAIWTLQHCLYPSQDIHQIAVSLKHGGKLFVVNNVHRAVPVRGGKWANDHIDVRALLKQSFIETAAGQLDESIAPAALRDETFWAVYERR